MLKLKLNHQQNFQKTNSMKYKLPFFVKDCSKTLYGVLVLTNKQIVNDKRLESMTAGIFLKSRSFFSRRMDSSVDLTQPG